MSSSRLMFAAVFVMAGAAILYELILAAVLSYLLGATVTYFSLTIGIFLFALGTGAWWSGKWEENLLRRFLTIEVLLGTIGGFAAPLIFALYAGLFRYLGGHVFNNLFMFLFQAGLTEILFHAVSFGTIFIIGVLVGIEVPIFTRIAAASRTLKDALAKVFFWDYAGALVASVLFPLLLLPALGFLKTGFLVGFLNLAAAVILAAGFSPAWPLGAFSRFGRILLFAGILILAVGFIYAPRLDEFFTRQIFAGSEVLFDRTSPYQRIQLIKNRDGKLSLFLNGELQFQEGVLEKRYHETFAHPVVSFMGERARRIFILGGGDGLLAREVLKYPSVEEITLVDIDEMVTDLAMTHPLLRELNRGSLSNPRLTIVHDDAFRWLLERRAQSRFNIVLVDFPDPTDPALTRLYSKEFYLAVNKYLDSSGIIVVHTGGLPSRFHAIVKETLKSAGYRTLAFHPPEADPTIGIPGLFEIAFIAASPSAITIATLYQRIGEMPTATPGVTGPYLYSAVEDGVVPNSLFHPIRSFGIPSSFVGKFIEVETATGNIFARFRAPVEQVRSDIEYVITRAGPLGALFRSK